MKLGESKTMRNGGTFTMTVARVLGNRKSADSRRSVRFHELRIHPHSHPLVQAFVHLLNADRLPLKTLAARSGIDRRVMHRWRIRSNPSLAMFEAALNAAGYELRIVRKRGRGE